MKKIKILAIETSCDETSIAIVENGNNVIEMVTNSQIEYFEKVGGVIPELSSRMHIDNIYYVYNQVFKNSNLQISDIDAIAITKGPGLIGSLLVGVNFAKSLSLLTNIPLIAVNHLHGHIHAINLDNQIKYPHLSLIVSGGHSEIIYMPKKNDYQKIGQTIDDAAGESFDKVARILGIGYPGGPVIDKLAESGQDTYTLPVPKDDKSLDFSFSGLKSATYNLNNSLKMKSQIINPENFACSFQNRVNYILIKKLQMAQKQYQVEHLSIVGGVSNNTDLRKRANKQFTNLMLPQSIYTSDNGAMIGAAAYEQFLEGDFTDPLTLNANSNLEIERKI